MTRALIPLLLLTLAACKQTDDTDPVDDTTDTTPVDPLADSPLMTDCEATPGNICPWAGIGSNGFNGEDKHRYLIMFSFPMSVTFSPYGPPMIADWNNHKIRQVEDDGTIHTVMGTDFLGDGDATRLDATPDGAIGTTVNLNHPTMQQYLSDGTLISASWHTHKIRSLDLSTDKVRVIMGNTPGFAPPEPADDRGAEVADHNSLLNQPKSIQVDASDNMYILDMRNERIRYWNRDNDTIRTIAGQGGKANDPAAAAACTTHEGDALSVCFAFPKNSNPEPGGALALDEDGQILYIADTESHVIRKLDLATHQLTILAGQYQSKGFADGAAASAQFNFPTDVELDGDTLFVADANNHRIRAIDLTTGEVSTFAGTGDPTCVDGEFTNPGDGSLTYVPTVCAEQPTSGDGGPATQAKLFRPFGIDLDLDGNLVIADTYNHRFRIVYR